MGHDVAADGRILRGAAHARPDRGAGVMVGAVHAHGAAQATLDAPPGEDEGQAQHHRQRQPVGEVSRGDAHPSQHAVRMREVLFGHLSLTGGTRHGSHRWRTVTDAAT